MSVVAPPTSTPGPCCMGDTYTHKTTNSFNQAYVWNAIAGNGTYGTVPQIYPTYTNNATYNIIPTTPNGEFVYGVWDFNLESGNLPISPPGIPVTVMAYAWGNPANYQFGNQSLVFSNAGPNFTCGS